MSRFSFLVAAAVVSVCMSASNAFAEDPTDVVNWEAPVVTGFGVVEFEVAIVASPLSADMRNGATAAKIVVVPGTQLSATLGVLMEGLADNETANSYGVQIRALMDDESTTEPNDEFYTLWSAPLNFSFSSTIQVTPATPTFS